MKKIFYLIAVFCFFSISAYAVGIEGETSKKELTWEDVLKWNKITSSQISKNGEHIAVVTKPWRGDGVLKLHDKKGQIVAEFNCGDTPQFLDDNNLIFVVRAKQSVLDSLERAKSKVRPETILMKYDIKNGKKEEIGAIVNYKISSEHGVLAYKVKEEKKEVLYIKSPKSELALEDVRDYKFSDKTATMVYYTDNNPAKVAIIDLKTLEGKEIFSSAATIKRLDVSTFDHGNISFMTGDKKDKKGVSNKLYLYNGEDVVDIKLPSNAPRNWIINEYGAITFSKTGDRLVFGTSPTYFEADTLTLPSRKAGVDVWHWSEPVLQTQQIINKNSERRKSYRAIYFASKNQSKQIATEEMPSVVFPNNSDADFAYIQNSEPYRIESMWRGGARSDLYILDLETLEKKEIFTAKSARVISSPKANYLYWFHPSDSSWYSYSVEMESISKLATPKDFITYNDLNDVPNHPGAQGSFMWNEDETEILVPGKYDIWKLSPKGEFKPENITKIGKEKNLRFRILMLDREKQTFDNKETLFLSVFNNTTKGNGFATLNLKKKKVEILADENLKFGNPIKVKEKDLLLVTKETFENAPDLYLYTTDMKEIAKITNINPQQSEYNWGTAELVTWVSLKGDTLQGLLYKPENFDPNKKYPMIANFYERSSTGLYEYRTPETHRSTIDYHYYTSNGYIIFNPDIKYYDGYPGQSCYDALMPGIDMIVSMGFVDEDRIGAQGHSWGGYQVAHLATVTDRFAAIESGAPVVNMISAYGGIRWQTGLNRAFQYETGQSRIGVSIWDDVDLYIENSPIFNMDKVTTPILIMHNDQDGHVPWWQGIEYFIALRRLQKPTWLLNYRNEPHWPLKQANQLDFQTRMGEFFDHYLKGSPMPEWMEKGVPAASK